MALWLRINSHSKLLLPSTCFNISPNNSLRALQDSKDLKVVLSHILSL